MSAFHDEWDDLDDKSLVPTGKTARELDRAHTDPAARIGMGVRASTEKRVNQVAQFPCEACGGTGRWRPRSIYSMHPGGPCRKCKGTGKLKTDPVKRRALRQARQTAKLTRLAAEKADWIARHPAEWAWMQKTAPRFDFALQMLNTVEQWGHLSDNQLAAVRKCVARDEQRAAEQAARKPDAELGGAGFERMLKAFATAKAAGLKYPKFTVDPYQFSPVTEKSKYPQGTLFVKRVDTGAYLGRIELGGRYFESRDSSPADRAHIEHVCKDPLAAAVLHGKQTGRCSCCGRELENEESVRLGIGPICRQKWGL